MTRFTTERGQTMPLLALVLALALGAASAVALFGARAGRLARAQAAADAVALAGASEPGLVAPVGRANGAAVAAVELAAGTVTVEIDHRGMAASASATRPSTDLSGLQPVMVAAIRTAESLLDRPLTVVSGYRSHGEQQWLWDHRDQLAYPVAPPGTSNHERGLAIDVPAAVVGPLTRVAARAGLCQPLPHTDPIHFELCPGT